MSSVASEHVWQRIWLGLVLAGSLVTLAAAPLPIIEGDTALWAQVARNILQSGEWLTLHYQVGWIVDKPPLTFWLMALSLSAIGDNPVALRGWQLLMSLLLVVVTYLIARLHAGREESLLAALLLLTFFQVFLQATIPGQDVALTLFLALAFYEWLRYRRSARPAAAASTGLWVALAVLTKGPIGLVVFVMVAAADAIVARRTRAADQSWRWGHVLLGAATFAIVATPWFIHGSLRQGFPFVDTFFLRGTIGFGRFLQPKIAEALPLWQALLAYVPLLALGMLPWTGVLPAAAREGWRTLRVGPPALRLCVLWVTAYLVLISLSLTDKVFRYLLLVYPPLAVVGARALIVGFNEPRRLRVPAVVTLGIGLPGMAGGIWMTATRFPQEVEIYLPLVLPFAITLALSMVAVAVMTLWRPGRAPFALLAAGTMLSFSLLTLDLMTRWEPLWPWQRVAAVVHRHHSPATTVVIFREKIDLPGYYIRVPLTNIDDVSVLSRAWRGGRTLVLLRNQDLVLLPASPTYRMLTTMPSGWALVINE